jgi:hypothetical protein
MTRSTQVGVKPTKRGGKGSRKKPSPLSGPLREVVYIFEREGTRGGSYWRLVLACGHSVARSRVNPNDSVAMISAMFRPLSEKLAPKRVQCFYCGSGNTPCDPWILIEAFGGPKRP